MLVIWCVLLAYPAFVYHLVLSSHFNLSLFPFVLVLCEMAFTWPHQPTVLFRVRSAMLYLFLGLLLLAVCGRLLGHTQLGCHGGRVLTAD